MHNQQDSLVIRHLGCRDYQPVWQAMKNFTDARGGNTPDECWLVQHPPVFTLGQAGKEEHILAYSQIPLVRTDRGGQVTYHGPGQLVVYLLVDLKRRNLGVRQFVQVMEQAIIAMLATYGIAAGLKEGAPGVYVDGAKIASLGLRVRKGCTYHGLSINVDMDLSPFRQINPCGYQGLLMAQMAQYSTEKIPVAEVEERLLQVLSGLLACPLYYLPTETDLPY